MVPSTSITSLGLIIHRQGGRNLLADVTVRFYEEDSNNGSTLIGDGTIPLLSPRSSSSTSSVNWTPSATGTYTIVAVIDPDNAITEENENNKWSRQFYLQLAKIR